MRRLFKAAVAEVQSDDGSYWDHLNLTLGYLLGAKLYGGAAAVRRAMRAAGVETGGLVEGLLRDEEKAPAAESDRG
jgi:hypothetical protein